MRKLTIGYILDDNLDVSDGVQQAVLQIGQKMKKRDHEVHYITVGSNEKSLENNHNIGKSISLKFNGNSVRTPLPIRTSKINKLLNEVKFDVLHVQMPYSPFFAAKVIKNASQDTAICGTFHILPYSKITSVSTRILGFNLRKSIQKIDRAYAVSKPSLTFMKESFGISGNILSNPVDYKFYNSFKSKKDPHTFSIVYVGRFDARKGVKNLIDAYELVSLQTNQKTKLIMCGKGPLLEKMKIHASNRGLNIEFPGFVSNEQKAKYLALSDIAIFPSISGESFGIVLTEAMSAGAGITLGGDNPGYASVLQKWPKVLFDATSPRIISDRIMEFMNNSELRTRIGSEQHDTVKAYDTEKIIDRLEADYYDLLAKKS